MPVSPSHLVGSETVMDLAEQGPGLGGTAGAGSPRFRVGDDGLRHNRPGRQQGSEAENNGRRVAARVRHQTASGDLFAIQLGQTIDCLVQKMAGRVRLIPLLIHRQVTETKIGREIDHLFAGGKKIRH